MLNRLKPKSEFSRNVLTLMTGTTIAQAIPIAISPILTRIYTPEDFGVFALYMSVASLLSVMATGRYELAIMLPKKDEDAVNIVALSIIIAFFVSFISFLIVFIFNTQITNLLGNPKISSWLYFIPITVLLTGMYQSFNYWSNRKKHYKRLATSRVVQSGTTATSNLGMGFGGVGSSGLILSTILGQSVATWVLGSRIFKNDFEFFKQSVKRLKIFALIKKYIDFPKINLLHSFLNVFSSSLPVFLISFFFSNVILGFYALANKAIVSPMGIITGSYSQVFMQKLMEHRNRKINEIKFFKNSVIKLMIYSFFPFSIFFMFAPFIFTIVFGDDWTDAGIYAQILIPMLYLRFTGSVVSSVTMIYDRQQKALKIEILNTVFRIIALIIGGIMNNIILGLILFSLLSSLITVYRLVWYVNIIKKDGRV